MLPTLPEDAAPGTDPRKLLTEEQWRLLFAVVFARHGLSRDGLAPESGGSDVVWGTPAVVAKLTAPRWGAEIQTEAFACGFLAGKLPFEVPPLIATGEVQGWPYVITGRIGGVGVGQVWGGLSHRERASLAGRIGEATAALHAVTPPAEPDGWVDFLAARRADLLHRHRDAPPDLLAQLPDFMAASPAPRGHRAFLHTELLDQHIHVARDAAGAWAVSGMLDFADGRVGEVGYDLTAPAEFIFKGESGIYPAFLDGYGLVEPDAEGLLRWYLLHLFGRLPRLVSRVGAAESLSALARRAFG